MPDSVTVQPDEITKAKRHLDDERAHGDPLRIELAEAALNDLLERFTTGSKV